MKHLVLMAALLLAACSTHTPLPNEIPKIWQSLPLSLQISSDDGRNTLLVIQAEGFALRWSLFDPLGVPLARQLLVNGAWHDDGLLPPNQEARELFAALLFALTPSDQARHNYAQQDWQQLNANSRKLAPKWRIDYPSTDSIVLHDGNQSLRIKKLETLP